MKTRVLKAKPMTKGERIVSNHYRLAGKLRAQWPKRARALARVIDNALLLAETDGIERGASIGANRE